MTSAVPLPGCAPARHGQVPPKNLWMMKNVMRKSVVMGLPPMKPPAIHPFNPLLSLRVASHQWGPPRTQERYAPLL